MMEVKEHKFWCQHFSGNMSHTFPSPVRARVGVVKHTRLEVECVRVVALHLSNCQTRRVGGAEITGLRQAWAGPGEGERSIAIGM